MFNKSLLQQEKGILKLLLFCICLCSMPVRGLAQRNIQEDDAEKTEYKPGNFGFNAIDIRQGRFLYDDSVKYKRDKFYDHMSVGIVWHYDKIHERIPQGYNAALNYGLFVEKELNKLHALRLLFYQGTYQQTSRSIRLNKYQMELLHSFNWTRFFGGYNPYRRIEAVTNLGVGGFYSERVDKVTIGPMFIMGAGARLQLSPLFTMGVEPYVALAGDGIDHSGSMNYRKYDVLYGTDVSLSYTFHKEMTEEQRKNFRGKTFVDFGLGVQLEPYTGYLQQENALPLLATAGPHLKLGIGHWLSPGLALRATGNLSSSNWHNTRIEENNFTHHPAYDIRLKNVLANGRVDFIFSPYHFITGREDNRFDITTIVGWEYGWMIKTAYDPANLLRTYYDGFSGGLQLRYDYDRHTALYLEPRLTLANYTVPYAEPYQDYVDRYRDYLFSMTAGLEFATNEYRFLSGKKQPSKFNPHISLSLQGGPNYLFVTKEHVNDFYIDYAAGVAGEMQVTPYSGVRVMADYSQTSYKDIYRYRQRLLLADNVQLSDTALTTGRYGFVNLSADYVFDLGTLLQGYNAANRWDVALAFGPVYSQRVREKAIISKDEMLWEFRGNEPVATVPEVDHSRVVDHALGIQFGIPVSYRVAPHWDVLFEPRARFFPSEYIEQVHSQGPTKILNAQLGARYTLNDRYYVQRSDSLTDFILKSGHLFAHMAVGAQTPRLLADMGPRIEAGVGYWFNPGVAARATVALTSHDWKRFPTTLAAPAGQTGVSADFSLRQMGAGGRFDLLLSPYGYLMNRYDLPFGLNFVGGWEYGMMLRGNMTETLLGRYNAVSAGLQLRYNNDDYRALYLEPRYTYNLTGKSSQYSVVAGMELGATSYAFRPRKRQPDEFESMVSLALLGGVGYAYNGKEYTDAPLSAYSGGIAGEYKFSPYSGARLTLGYTNCNVRALYSYHHKDFGTSEHLYNYSAGYMNVGVDYMFDISTLLQGYTRDRAWNAALAVGPAYGLRMAQSEPAADAGYTPSYSATTRKHLFGVQAGVPLSYSVNGNWDILFEPRGKVVLKHPFDVRTPYPFAQYEALLGMKYSPSARFYSRVYELNADHDYRHDFVNYALGVQYAAGNGIPFGATGGLQLGLGVGRWMNSLWGVRFGGEMAASHLSSIQVTEQGLTYDRLLKSGRIGARADMMVNPLTFAQNYTPAHWGTALLLGLDFGAKVDALYSHLRIRPYTSLSLGAQLRYHTDERHALYIEPRYMFNDGLVSMTAGMEFATTEHRFRSRKNQPGEFKPYYNIGLAGGVNHLFLTSIPAGMPQLGVHAGLSGEYHFTPYSGARLTLDYAEVANGVPYAGQAMEYRLGHFNTGIDYMFDLSTLFAGYTPDRRWDVSLAAGAVFSSKATADSEYAEQFAESAIGAQVGVPVQFHLNKNWGISLEPRAQVFGENYAAPQYIAGGALTEIVNVQLGMKYTPGKNFYRRMDEAGSNRDYRHDFVNYAIGMQYAAGNGIPLGATGGIQLGLGAGRWMNTLWGVRFGAEMAASHLRSERVAVGGVANDLLLKSARIGARADVMVNPLAFVRSYTPDRWGTALLLGWEYGGKVDSRYTYLDIHTYNSLSVGAQVRFHTDERHALYIEPRYMVDDRLVSVTAGMEFAMTEHRFRSGKNQPDEFKPYYNVGFAGGVNHLFNPMVYAGADQLDFDLGLSGEYHFTPYSGTRLTFGYSHMVNGMPLGDKLVNYGMGHLNMGVDYMFDLSTLFAGYTADRRWDVSLAAGPVFSARVAADKEYARTLKKSTVGMQLGVPVQFHVNRHFGISLEPRARFFGTEYAAPHYVIRGLTSVINLQMGMKYTF